MTKIHFQNLKSEKYIRKIFFEAKKKFGKKYSGNSIKNENFEISKKLIFLEISEFSFFIDFSEDVFPKFVWSRKIFFRKYFSDFKF